MASSHGHHSRFSVPSANASRATRFRFRVSEDELLLETILPEIQEDIKHSMEDFWLNIRENLRSENPRFEECSIRTLQEHTLTMIKAHKRFRTQELNDYGKEYQLTTKCILLDQLLEVWPNYEEYERLQKQKRKLSRRSISIRNLGHQSSPNVMNEIKEETLNGLIIDEGNDSDVSENSIQNVGSHSPTFSSSSTNANKRLKTKHIPTLKSDTGLDYLQQKLMIDKELEEKRLALESRRLDLQAKQLEIEEKKWEAKRKSQEAIQKRENLFAEVLVKILDKLK